MCLIHQQHDHRHALRVSNVQWIPKYTISSASGSRTGQARACLQIQQADTLEAEFQLILMRDLYTDAEVGQEPQLK